MSHKIFHQQAFDRRMDRLRTIAIAKHSVCDVHGCNNKNFNFVGGQRAWLYFCFKHREIAKAIAFYFNRHANARPKAIDKKLQ